MRKLKEPVLQLKATHTGGKKAVGNKAKDCVNLEKELLLCHGTKVQDFIWEVGTVPHKDLPIVIMVEPMTGTVVIAGEKDMSSGMTYVALSVRTWTGTEKNGSILQIKGYD